MGKKRQTDNILWASYGPDVSESLMRYGIYLAGLFETGIESLYIIPTTYNEEKYDYFTELEKKLNAEWTELTAKENLDKLKSLQKIIQSTSIKTSDKIIEGVPCHEIIKFINEQPVSMIVMGKGMKMGGNYILQKTTHYVIKNSTVPVFIADSSNEIRDIKNILVPVFQNQINSRSLKFALNIAGKIGAENLTTRPPLRPRPQSSRERQDQAFLELFTNPFRLLENAVKDTGTSYGDINDTNMEGEEMLENIDYASLRIFPCVFLLFLVLFWSVFLMHDFDY